MRRDLPPASASRSVPIPLLLACVAAAFALGASVSGLLVSCACRRPRRPRSKDIETPSLPRALSLRSLARLHGSEPTPPSKDSPGAQAPQLYTPFLPPPDAVPHPELACLPTPESTPELPAKHLRPQGGAWEWNQNQNGNNAKEGSGRAGGPAPRVLVRPPPPGCPGQAVEVTTLEELLRYLHGPSSHAHRAPETPGVLPRDRAPPLRLDVPPDGRPAPAPRLGVGGTRRPPFTPRTPPALLTRVPSRGLSRLSGCSGRPLLDLGRPEGYRGRGLKRVDLEKPHRPPKTSMGAPSPPVPMPMPSGGHLDL